MARPMHVYNVCTKGEGTTRQTGRQADRTNRQTKQQTEDNQVHTAELPAPNKQKQQSNKAKARKETVTSR